MSRIDQSYLVGLIGSGIGASLTPPMHEEAGDSLGIRYLYRPLDIDSLGPHRRRLAAQDCGRVLQQGLDLGYNAFNVTHPCKELIMDKLDHLSIAAQEIGAVNTVVLRGGQTYGYNTDWSGFSWALTQTFSSEVKNLSPVLQLGSGGAGSATAYALLKLGVGLLYLYDLDGAKAGSRANKLGQLFPQQQVLALDPQDLAKVAGQVKGLVNASPCGMHQHPGIPFDLKLLQAGSWVTDIIYLPEQTELINQARQLGLSTLTGGLMAVGQAAQAFELITGQKPDLAAMQEHFKQLLEAQNGQ